MAQQLIYVIEDELNIRELIKFALESYQYRVRSFEMAEEALDAMDTEKPDLAVFDIMLPQMDGITAVKKIRKRKGMEALPVILLTAKDSELDKVIGLDCGADDYMTKPFSMLELAARIRSLLRRSSMNAVSATDEIIMIESMQINTGTREVFVSNQAADLTFKEYELLLYLVRHRPNAVDREQLMEKIWGYDYIGESRTLDIHISSLRQKLGPMGTYIKTVRSVGYRFGK